MDRRKAKAAAEIDYIGLAHNIDINRDRIGMSCMWPFAEVLPLLSRDAHGIEVSDIRAVLGCWVDFDLDEAWAGGSECAELAGADTRREVSCLAEVPYQLPNGGGTGRL